MYLLYLQVYEKSLSFVSIYMYVYIRTILDLIDLSLLI